jgi:sulfotransferase family protein
MADSPSASDPKVQVAPAQDVLRLAIVSTPRSGNTWLRGLLTAMYGLKEFAVHTPEELDWQNLPPRMVVQIHWHPVEPFLSLVKEHGVRVIALARHPFDVFISSLNYQQYVDSPLRWSNRDGQGEISLLGASPRSNAFLDFACGWAGESVLAVSHEWWRVPGTIPVRYEDLVKDTAGELKRLATAIGVPPVRPAELVAMGYAIDRLRVEYDIWHYHYWQGKAGQWKLLLPPKEAQQIAETHASVFQDLGYVCDPDPNLDARQADLNWMRLQFDSMRQHLESERAKHAQTRKTLDAERQRLAHLDETLAIERAHTTTAVRALNALHQRHQARTRALARVKTRGLKRLGLGRKVFAHPAHRLMARRPWIATAIARVIRPLRRSA